MTKFIKVFGDTIMSSENTFVRKYSSINSIAVTNPDLSYFREEIYPTKEKCDAEFDTIEKQLMGDE